MNVLIVPLVLAVLHATDALWPWWSRVCAHMEYVMVLSGVLHADYIVEFSEATYAVFRGEIGSDYLEYCNPKLYRTLIRPTTNGFFAREEDPHVDGNPWEMNVTNVVNECRKHGIAVSATCGPNVAMLSLLRHFTAKHPNWFLEPLISK